LLDYSTIRVHRKIPPPLPREKYQPMSFGGKKYEKGKRKRWQMLNQKGRKEKEKERRSKRVK
jgi:hypothetical protein